MTCINCADARISKGLFAFYDNRRCVYCAARLIQAIREKGGDPKDTSKRMTEMLTESVAAGLSEQRIRELVKGGMAVEPITKEKA